MEAATFAAWTARMKTDRGWSARSVPANSAAASTRFHLERQGRPSVHRPSLRRPELWLAAVAQSSWILGLAMQHTHSTTGRIRVKGQSLRYCGETRLNLDHFPPKAVTSEGYLLPACHECNTALGDRHPQSFRFASLCRRFPQSQVRRLPESTCRRPDDTGDTLSRQRGGLGTPTSRRLRRLTFNALAQFPPVEPPKAAKPEAPKARPVGTIPSPTQVTKRQRLRETYEERQDKASEAKIA